MPTDASDTYGSVHKFGTATFLARLVDAAGRALVPADVTAVVYNLYLLSPDDPDARTSVAGHHNLSLSPAAVLFGSLHSGAIWSRDATGYNFRHTPDVSAHPAFSLAGREYLVEYRLTPAAGQAILVRFRVNVI
jgi:hypothetical protein